VTKRLWLAASAALLVAAALLAAGCGEKKEQLKPGTAVPFSLMLDFFPNADHAGIYAAKSAGYFEQSGLNLSIRTPNDPSLPIKEVAAGRVDLAISYEPELLLARNRGLHVVAVGALVQKPLTSIISLDKPAITRPSQLADKKIGTAGIDYQSAYLKTILERAHVNPSSVKEQNVGFNLVSALASHKVDAILGGYWNYEGVQLALAKRHPHIMRLDQVGVPTYNELVLVANADGLEQEGPKIRRFIGALSRGVRDLRSDQSKAIQGLLKANPDLDPRLQQASVKVTLPDFLAPPGKPYGWQDPTEWNAFAAWMHASGIIKATNANGALTNEFLPGQGL
jgi:putative hydroxymethylpyrimidine transport system substrate-binding protein